MTSRLDMPFVGIPTFLRSRHIAPGEALPDDALAAVVGIPFDEGQPYMAAARLGPRALREQSLRFVAGDPGIYDPNARERRLVRTMGEGLIVDLGDVDVLPTNVMGTFDNVTTALRGVLDAGVVPVVLGGDHSVTYPVVRAYDEAIHVVHFDAHLDYAPFVHGVEMSNSNPFRHVAAMPHVASLTQVGIRSLRNTEVMHSDSERDGNAVVTMRRLAEEGSGCVLGAIPEGAPVYLSIDVDVLDISLVPGCISAEPSGMSYDELMGVLADVVAHSRIVGVDLVEVSPVLDVRTQVTSYLGAHIVIDLLSRFLP